MTLPEEDAQSDTETPENQNAVENEWKQNFIIMLLILEKKNFKKNCWKILPKKNLQKMGSANIRQGERQFSSLLSYNSIPYTVYGIPKYIYIHLKIHIN